LVKDKEIPFSFNLFTICLNEKLNINNFQEATNMKSNTNISSIILKFLVFKYFKKKELLNISMKDLEIDIDKIIKEIITLKTNHNFSWTNINNGHIEKLKMVECTNLKTNKKTNLVDLFDSIKY